MNYPNNLPARGLFRNERKLLGDYRQRAYWIGALQLSGSIGYLPAALLFNKLMWITSAALKLNYNFTDTADKNRASNPVDIDALERAFSGLYFWLVLNVIRAFLHIFSSVCTIWASFKSTPKLRAIWLCHVARKMNLAFLLYEIVVFLLMYQEWEFGFYFILYRFWFNHEVQGLLNTIQMLSPPPPGYYC